MFQSDKGYIIIIRKCFMKRISRTNVTNILGYKADLLKVHCDYFIKVLVIFKGLHVLVHNTIKLYS